MIEASLIREIEWKGAVISTLFLDQNPDKKWFTLSEKWRDNKTDISCIPDGDYIVELFRSPKRGWVYLIKNVPGRTWVEMHIGNTVADTLGCELYGMEVTLSQKEARTFRSAEAMAEFHNATGGDALHLKIRTKLEHEND